MLRYPAMPDAPGPRGKPVVLIVDDNDDTRDAYARYFAQLDCQVGQAAGGEPGVEAAVALRPDVVLMDLSMPDVDGFAATRKLRRREETRDVVIVAVTGYAYPDFKERAMAAGVNAFLVKPIAPDDLVREVNALLRAAGKPTC